MIKEDLTGREFPYLKVIDFSHINKNRQSVWNCKCICGNVTKVTRTHLLTGHTTSCGCRKNLSGVESGMYKHGMTNTRLYEIYKGMIKRCFNTKHKAFKDYGGRGITIYQEWIDDFMNFHEWAMNNGYQDNLTIDRIDVNGNYEPNNCRWETYLSQANNKRDNVFATYKGKTQTLSMWAREFKIPTSSIYSMYHRVNENFDLVVEHLLIKKKLNIKG